MTASSWPDSETLRQSVLRAWNEHPPAGHDTLRQIRLVPPPRTYTYSKVYEFVLESSLGKVRQVVVKVPVEDQAHTLPREFLALKHLSEHFQARKDLAVPQPLLLLDHPLALVMEKAEGVRLVRQVQSCRRIFKRKGHDLPAQFRRAGRWLAHLHHLEPLPESAPRADATIRYERALAILQRVSAPPSALVHLQTHLRPRLHRLPRPPSLPLHGDFTLRNILCTDQGITVIDTTLSHTGAAEIDVASFLAALRYIDWGQMWLGHWLYRPSCLAQAQYLFLDSYQAVGGKLDFAILDTLIALQCLQRWADFVTHVNRRYPPLSRTLLRQRLHRHFAACTLSALGSLENMTT